MFTVKLYDNHIRGELISLLPLRVNPLKENDRLLTPPETRTLGYLDLIIFTASIKEIAFGEKVSREGKEGIVLVNETGRLIISKESLENLIYSVVKDVPGAETVMSRTILDKDKNLIEPILDSDSIEEKIRKLIKKYGFKR